MKYGLVFLISYLIGSISGSFIIGKLFLGKDVRNAGSGNAGTTNAFRVLGVGGGLGTFFIDFLKGIILVLVIKKFFGQELIFYAVFCGILGHDFPVYMNFKGGKGMAMTLGTFAAISVKLTIIPYLIWLSTVLITKYVSLGSILFFISSVIFYIVFGKFSNLSNIFVILICLMGIFRHKSNIIRLINGNENKIGGKK